MAAAVLMLDTSERLEFTPIVSRGELLARAMAVAAREHKQCEREYEARKGRMSSEEMAAEAAEVLECSLESVRVGVWYANAVLFELAEKARWGSRLRECLWEDASWECHALVEAARAVASREKVTRKRKRRPDEEAERELVAACVYWVVSVQKFEATGFDPPVPQEYMEVSLFLSCDDGAAARNARRVALGLDL